MKLAIHHRENSFSHRWIEYCGTNNVQYKIVDCYANNIFEQIFDCDGLLWHWDLNDYRSALVTKQITKALEIRGIKVFPNMETSWHFDDKVGQKYIFEAIQIPIVTTLSFPAISLRQSMERPEAQDAGTIVLTGFDPDVVLSSVKTVIEEHKNGKYQHIPFEYKILNTSWRVLKLILGNTKLSNKWWGISEH